MKRCVIDGVTYRSVQAAASALNVDYWIAQQAAREGTLKSAEQRKAEHYARLSAALTGRKHSEESRAKISAAARRSRPFAGRTHTEETKAKISAARQTQPSPMLGRRHTEETKAKMSAAQARRWAHLPPKAPKPPKQPKAPKPPKQPRVAKQAKAKPQQVPKPLHETYEQMVARIYRENRRW